MTGKSRQPSDRPGAPAAVGALRPRRRGRRAAVLLGTDPARPREPVSSSARRRPSRPGAAWRTCGRCATPPGTTLGAAVKTDRLHDRPGGFAEVNEAYASFFANRARRPASRSVSPRCPRAPRSRSTRWWRLPTEQAPPRRVPLSTAQRHRPCRRAGAGVVRETPVLSSRTLSGRAGFTVALKAENLQRTGSFKLRGALAKIAALGDELLGRGRRRQRRQPRAGGRVRGAHAGRAAARCSCPRAPPSPRSRRRRARRHGPARRRRASTTRWRRRAERADETGWRSSTRSMISM